MNLHQARLGTAEEWILVESPDLSRRQIQLLANVCSQNPSLNPCSRPGKVSVRIRSSNVRFLITYCLELTDL